MNTTEMTKRISIQMHAARDSKGRIIWIEIIFDGHPVDSMNDLRKLLGEKVRLLWRLNTPMGRIVLEKDDPRIEQEGFLLRIGENGIQKDITAECLVIA